MSTKQGIIVGDDDFKESKGPDGDVTSMIFTFQELYYILYSNDNYKGIGFLNAFVYSRIKGPNRRKHHVFVFGYVDQVTTFDAIDKSILTDDRFLDSFAEENVLSILVNSDVGDRANLCPPDNPSITYTTI